MLWVEIIQHIKSLMKQNLIQCTKYTLNQISWLQYCYVTHKCALNVPDVKCNISILLFNKMLMNFNLFDVYMLQ